MAMDDRGVVECTNEMRLILAVRSIDMIQRQEEVFPMAIPHPQLEEPERVKRV